MGNKINSIKGFQDILPEDSIFYREIEKMLSSLTNSFGIKEVRTPILERSELFNRSIGDSTDIVNKEMYSFEDKNGDNICLRPEGTAGILRSMIQHNMIYDRGIKKQKIWYYGPMFRHEKPQKGRYRQFTQFGIEYFGYDDTNSEIELIQMMNTFFKSLNLSNIKFHINSLGNLTDRNNYKEIIKSNISDKLETFEESIKLTFKKNPLRLLDSKNENVAKLCAGLPNLLDNINSDSKNKFDDFVQKLEDLGIEYIIDNSIVRGLDYYNDLVFEWKADQLGAQNAICAGGRYDNLVNELGDTSVPAIGLAMGVERIIELLKSENYQNDHLVLPFVDEHGGNNVNFIKITNKIREKHKNINFFNTDTSASFKSQLKYAKKINPDIAILIDSTKLSDEIKIYYVNSDTELKISIKDLNKNIQDFYE